ncbi:MAG: DNA-directed RNA polymerase subunit alpha [Deltaproteobacteria bacterium]|nr:DNA-directed RNA polymerase subunit alpha [Deltaproteobacteria bacterium]
MDKPMYAKNWEDLQLPKSIEVDNDSYSNTYGMFTVEPLEKGFGVTVGHSLRRILLSSLQGSAVVAVKIDGVSHEFEGISGVHEDVVQIILNLKALSMQQSDEGIHEMELVGEGPCQLKASDIVTGGKVEMLNPDQVIATLDEGGKLEMRMYATLNKGYVTAEENHRDRIPDDAIYLDSVHTPIKRVNYEVQTTRVGQKTDYDKLIFEVWTNGSINPREALSFAAKIMKEHLIPFIDFDEQQIAAQRSLERAEMTQELNENLYKSVAELELSVRSINCLQSAKIETIGELVQKTETEMLKTKNFGRKSLNEIKSILNNMGLSLGMRLDGFDPNNKPAPVPPPTTETT